MHWPTHLPDQQLNEQDRRDRHACWHHSCTVVSQRWL